MLRPHQVGPFSKSPCQKTHLLVAVDKFTKWIEVMGSQHRKQKNSYTASGINPKDLDLLDEDSEGEIQSLTLEDQQTCFVGAGVGYLIPATRLV